MVSLSCLEATLSCFSSWGGSTWAGSSRIKLRNCDIDKSIELFTQFTILSNHEIGSWVYLYTKNRRMLLIFRIPLSHSIRSGIIRNPTIPTIFICALIRFGNEAGIVGHARLFSLTDVNIDDSLIAISECWCLPNLGLNSYQ